MSELGKTVGQLIVNNLSITIVIILWILSGLFKITKKEINPLGWVTGKIGKAITKDVRKDVAELKTSTDSQISDLRTDLDNFEKQTNKSIGDIQKGTTANCRTLKKELDAMKKSNDMQTVQTIKNHILDFANSCMNHRKHTKQDFENVIKENELYESLCKKYKLKNNVYDEDYAFIMKIYHKCQEENTFLKASEAG